MDLATVGVVAVVVLVTGWLVQYARSRDAESATESVAGVLGTIVLGGVTVVTVIIQQGAETLSQIGDVVVGPWLAQILTGAVGWLGFSGRIALTPRTWIVAVVGILLVIIMIDRGR